MTGVEFVNNYGSRDEDDWNEQEEYMRKLATTIRHFEKTREPVRVQVGVDTWVEQPPTLLDFANWLEAKADE